MLNGTLKRARPKHGIKTCQGQLRQRRIRHLKAHVLLGHPLCKALHLYASNRLDMFRLQSVEHDDFVNPVQELRPESRLKFVPHDRFNYLIRLASHGLNMLRP